MKKINLLLMLAMMVSLVSCSNDDEPETPAQLAAKTVPGTYKGYTVANSMYFQDMTAGEQEIVITKNGDDTYKVDYTSDTWGEFAIEAATVSYENGKFSIAGEGATKMGMNGNIKEYGCTLAGTIDADKEDPTFTFTVPTVMGGLTVAFHSGTMPDAAE